MVDKGKPSYRQESCKDSNVMTLPFLQEFLSLNILIDVAETARRCVRPPFYSWERDTCRMVQNVRGSGVKAAALRKSGGRRDHSSDDIQAFLSSVSHLGNGRSSPLV